MNPLDELNTLVRVFPGESRLIERVEHIASALTPEPYKQLLVHDQHMTVTMERYHRSEVDVRILDRKLDGTTYTRKILLCKSGTQEVVQFGIVRFDLSYVTQPVRDAILDGDTPLGRILIDYNVLRHIDLGAILKITCGPGLARHFQTEAGQVTYGRLATIFCNKSPAVDLLEISRPLRIEE